jgi:hypothetical protein
MGAQGDPQRGRVREIFERPHHRPIRKGDLGRETVSGDLKKFIAGSGFPGSSQVVSLHLFIPVERN